MHKLRKQEAMSHAEKLLATSTSSVPRAIYGVATMTTASFIAAAPAALMFSLRALGGGQSSSLAEAIGVVLPAGTSLISWTLRGRTFGRVPLYPAISVHYAQFAARQPQCMPTSLRALQGGVLNGTVNNCLTQGGRAVIRGLAHLGVGVWTGVLISIPRPLHIIAHEMDESAQRERETVILKYESILEPSYSHGSSLVKALASPCSVTRLAAEKLSAPRPRPSIGATFAQTFRYLSLRVPGFSKVVRRPADRYRDRAVARRMVARHIVNNPTAPSVELS